MLSYLVEVSNSSQCLSGFLLERYTKVIIYTVACNVFMVFYHVD